MKHLLGLLLCCLALTGCAAAPNTQETTIPTEPAVLYEPGSPMELRYPGAVRTYALPMEEVLGIHTLGNDVLVFSGLTATTVTRLSGEDLTVSGCLTLDHFLSPDDHSLSIGDRYLSFFDPSARETVVLNAALEAVSRVAAPQDLVGTPILSRDGRTLYYCTANAIRAWDLESGIRRLLKEISFPAQTLTGSYLNDTVLRCAVTDEAGVLRTMLISAADGRLLYDRDGAMTVVSGPGRCYAAIPTGVSQLLLFGSSPEDIWSLTTGDLNDGRCFFQANRHGAILAADSEAQTTLTFYDLSTGFRSSALSLEDSAVLAAEDTREGWVYVLAHDRSADRDLLYRWNIPALPCDDLEVYTAPYHRAQAPDLDGLARCQAYAQDISDRYGLDVLIGADAADANPWDYSFEPEHLVPILWRGLSIVDSGLSHFPQSILDATKSHFSSVKICLVRSIRGASASEGLENANGLQFFDSADTGIAIAIGPRCEQALYHELFHIMETRLLSKSTAFDQWDNLNPAGFTYTNGYSPVDPEDLACCQGEHRSFIDAYSMTYPKEDRARIMEYAMTPGHEDLFRSKILQLKLEALCLSIRQAYGLKKSPEAFLWEQYLNTSMAYTK